MRAGCPFPICTALSRSPEPPTRGFRLFLQGPPQKLYTNDQWVSLTDQLNIGVRFLELDTHWVAGELRTAHCGGLHAPVLNTLLRALNALSKLAGQKIHWDTETIGCAADSRLQFTALHVSAGIHTHEVLCMHILGLLIVGFVGAACSLSCLLLCSLSRCTLSNGSCGAPTPCSISRTVCSIAEYCSQAINCDKCLSECVLETLSRGLLNVYPRGWRGTYAWGKGHCIPVATRRSIMYRMYAAPLVACCGTVGSQMRHRSLHRSVEVHRCA